MARIEFEQEQDYLVTMWPRNCGDSPADCPGGFGLAGPQLL